MSNFRSRLISLLSSLNPFLSPLSVPPHPMHLKIHLFSGILCLISIIIYSTLSIYEYYDSPPTAELSYESIEYDSRIEDINRFNHNNNDHNNNIPLKSPLFSLFIDGSAIPSLSQLNNWESYAELFKIQCPINSSNFYYGSLTSPYDIPVNINLTSEINGTIGTYPGIGINVYGTTSPAGNVIGYLTYPEECFNMSDTNMNNLGYVYGIAGVSGPADSIESKSIQVQVFGGNSVYAYRNGQSLLPAFGMLFPSRPLQLTISLTRRINVDGSIENQFIMGQINIFPSPIPFKIGAQSVLVLFMEPNVLIVRYSRPGLLNIFGSISGASGAILLAWRYIANGIIWIWEGRKKKSADNQNTTGDNIIDENIQSKEKLMNNQYQTGQTLNNNYGSNSDDVSLHP